MDLEGVYDYAIASSNGLFKRTFDPAIKSATANTTSVSRGIQLGLPAIVFSGVYRPQRLASPKASGVAGVVVAVVADEQLFPPRHGPRCHVAPVAVPERQIWLTGRSGEIGPPEQNDATVRPGWDCTRTWRREVGME